MSKRLVWLKHSAHRAMRAAVMLVLCSVTVIPAAYANETEAQTAYDQALGNISRGQFKEALQVLRQLQKQYPSFSNISGVKTRIAILHESDIAGSELLGFLRALDSRDAGNADRALIELRLLTQQVPNSPLVDDALYLMAYIQVMERFDYEEARRLLIELVQKAPDTAYLDAADYLNAIALEQSGDTAQAILQFEALRDRHTGVSLPFGYRVARGNVLSRYWFDRANQRLQILAEQKDKASSLAKRTSMGDEGLLVSVLIGGVEADLVLQASGLTRDTQWRDGRLRDQLPPSVGVYSGYVVGDEDSWARVVLSGDDIHGSVRMQGQEYRLHTEDLIGTLDYYQPKHRAGEAIKMGGSNPDLPMLLDTLPTPPISPRSHRGSVDKRASSTDLRVVPLSIVIDSQYNRYYNGQALAYAINTINVADAIYRPLGLALMLDETVVIDADSQFDPLDIGPNTLEAMLRNFRDYRMDKDTLFSDSALVYLFTGNPKTDVTLGLAWIDTACRYDGFDVGVTTPSSFSDVLFTHELGHSLGARHDTETECSGSTGFLMSPRISGNTATSMTSCSQTSIANSLNRACFLDALDLSLNLQQVGDSVAIDVRNLDSVRTVSAQVNIEVDSTAQVDWPSLCEVTGPGSAACQIPALQPNSVHSLNVAFRASEQPRLSAQVSTNETVDPTPSNNVVALNMDPISNTPVVVASNDFPTGTASTNAASQSSNGSVGWVWLAGLAAALLASAADGSGQGRFALNARR